MDAIGQCWCREGCILSENCFAFCIRWQHADQNTVKGEILLLLWMHRCLPPRVSACGVCLWVAGSVSDIWWKEKKTRAKLITVWATFSDTHYLSPTRRNTHTVAAFSSPPPLSHVASFGLAQSAEIKVLRHNTSFTLKNVIQYQRVTVE